MGQLRIVALITSLVFVNSYGLKSENLKLCVVGDTKVKTTHTTKFCNLLEKSKSTKVNCIYESDRLGCLWAVFTRKADFSVFEPEDLYFASLLDESLLLVVSEIKDFRAEPYEYGTVVVVRKNIGGLKDLAGKKLCHPGLKSGRDWNSLLFAQYFEERIAPPNCEEGLTTYEDRIQATANFFGSACKAGPWVVNQTEDERLKAKYSNLCALCDSGDCGVNEKYRGSGGAITCFAEGVGDILWAHYKDIKIHLKQSTPDVYNYLCDDGTLMPSTTNNPCIWLAKPWKVLGANRKSSTEVQKIVEMLTYDGPDEWESNFLHVIELYTQTLENLKSVRTPEDYLRSIPGYLSASSMSEGNCKPKHSIKLCITTSVEKVKCIWMSKAAASISVRPSLECIQKPNMTSCLKSVARTETDVVVVPPDYLYDTALNGNLNILLMETAGEFSDSYLLSAVVLRNSRFARIEDLKNTVACFTRRRGIGWISALQVLRQKKLISSKGGGKESLLEFFKAVCIFNSKEEEELQICCPAMYDTEGDEVNLLHCLEKECCDVAFLDFNNAKRSKGENSSNAFGKEFRVVCKDDSNCEWSWSNPNYLMVSSNIKQTKFQEVFSTFFQFGKLFGRKTLEANNMLRIFGPTSDVSNILFRDTSTSFLVLNQWNQSNYYMDLIQQELKSNAATTLKVVLSGLVCMSIIIYLLFN